MATLPGASIPEGIPTGPTGRSLSSLRAAISRPRRRRLAQLNKGLPRIRLRQELPRVAAGGFLFCPSKAGQSAFCNTKFVPHPDGRFPKRGSPNFVTDIRYFAPDRVDRRYHFVFVANTCSYYKRTAPICQAQAR